MIVKRVVAKLRRRKVEPPSVPLFVYAVRVHEFGYLGDLNGSAAGKFIVHAMSAERACELAIGRLKQTAPVGIGYRVTSCIEQYVDALLRAED